MKGIIKHCFILTFFIFCLVSNLLGQGGNSESEYAFVLQEMENGHTNISWEGANEEGHLGYIFSLYNNLGDLVEHFQIIESNISVVLEEDCSWDVEDVITSEVVAVIEDLPDIQVNDEIDIPIKEALGWYQGEIEIVSPELKDAINDNVNLNIELYFDDTEFINEEYLTNIGNNWQGVNWQDHQASSLDYYQSLGSPYFVKWQNRSSDTLSVDVDYLIKYSVSGSNEKITNIASTTLIFVDEYGSKTGAALNNAATLDIYPTVFNEQLNWRYTQSEEAVLSLEIFDSNGRSVYTHQKLDASSGAYQKRLETSHWSTGNYFVVYEYNGKIEKWQLMKLP